MPQHMRRSGIIIGLLALGLLAGPAQAASGPGPYYAEPAWDRKLPAATRFLVLTDWNSEAVLDKETGLVWERSPAITTHTWSAARVACTGRTTGTRKGWRLPSVHELASLVYPSVAAPGLRLQPGHPFLTGQSVDYWSATTYAIDPTAAWCMRFSAFDAPCAGSKTISSFAAWCVRGGMHADAY